MDTNRTYGIEIECYSSVTRTELAARIDGALVDLGHRTAVTGYQPNTDSTNTTVWTVKTDGSLNSNCPRGHHGVEVVSPVLTGHEGLQALAAVCEVLDRLCQVNKACGLHVHHGVKADELEPIAQAWMYFEPAIMQAMPPSRRANRYCKQWHSLTGIQNGLSRLGALQDKYCTLNMTSYRLRGTVEFRCHSGTIDCSKIKNWVLFTQGLIKQAVKGTQLPTEASITAAANFVGTDEVRPVNRYRQIRKQVADLVAEHGSMSFDEIVQALDGYRPTNAMRKFLQDGFMVKENGRYRIAGQNADPDYTAAAQWLQDRHGRFARA